MEPGQTIYLGDGVYLHFDGYGFELRANHHENPTDRIYIDLAIVRDLIRIFQVTFGGR